MLIWRLTSDDRLKRQSLVFPSCKCDGHNRHISSLSSPFRWVSSSYRCSQFSGGTHFYEDSLDFDFPAWLGPSCSFLCFGIKESLGKRDLIPATLAWFLPYLHVVLASGYFCKLLLLYKITTWHMAKNRRLLCDLTLILC